MGAEEALWICRCVLSFVVGVFCLVILKAVLNPCLLSIYVFLSLLIFFYAVRFGKKKKKMKWFFEMRDDLIQIDFARLFFS